MGRGARGCSLEDCESFWRSFGSDRGRRLRCLHEPSPQAIIMVASVLMQSIVAVHGVSGRRGLPLDSSERRGFSLASPTHAGPHGEKHVTA
jgi:hypothetical protein